MRKLIFFAIVIICALFLAVFIGLNYGTQKPGFRRTQAGHVIAGVKMTGERLMTQSNGLRVLKGEIHNQTDSDLHGLGIHIAVFNKNNEFISTVSFPVDLILANGVTPFEVPVPADCAKFELDAVTDSL